jgi:nickel transport protein
MWGRLAAAIPACLAVMLATGAAHAHRMDYAATTGEAAVVSVSYPFGQIPMFEPYRVYAPDSEVAFQTGRTDSLGRVSFLPDRSGEWRVVVTTEDGHGIEAAVRIDEAADLVGSDARHSGGPLMVLAGVGYLLGIAGALLLLRRWRSNGRECSMDRRQSSA